MITTTSVIKCDGPNCDSTEEVIGLPNACKFISPYEFTHLDSAHKMSMMKDPPINTLWIKDPLTCGEFCCLTCYANRTFQDFGNSDVMEKGWNSGSTDITS